MRVLQVLLGTHPISLRVEEGVDFPMIGTAIGTAYLSTQPAKIVERKLGAWSAHVSVAARKGIGEIMSQIADAREKGYATAYDAVIADTGAVAMPVMRTDDSEPLVIAVAGLNLRIRRKEQSIIRAMQKTVLHGQG